MNTISRYCPNCDKQIEIPSATEVYAQGCDECGSAAAALWPSKAMYDRHEMLEAKKKQEAEDALNAPHASPPGRGPVEMLTPADVEKPPVIPTDENDTGAGQEAAKEVQEFLADKPTDILDAKGNEDKAAEDEESIEETGKAGDQGE